MWLIFRYPRTDTLRLRLDGWRIHVQMHFIAKYSQTMLLTSLEHNTYLTSLLRMDEMMWTFPDNEPREVQMVRVNKMEEQGATKQTTKYRRRINKGPNLLGSLLTKKKKENQTKAARKLAKQIKDW